MKLSNLTRVSTGEIVNSFNAAFADYFVEVQFTPEIKERRMRRSRIQRDLSAAVFEDDHIIAFILSGVDQWEGQLTAYNAGTGVLPQYRRKSHVQRLYDFLLPLFAEQGIRQSVLEVVQENTYAIRAYEKVGFEIGRKFLCYGGTLSNLRPLARKYQWSKVETLDWERYLPLQAFAHSWAQNQTGVEAVKEDYGIYELRRDEELLAYCIFDPASRSIIQAGVADNDWERWGPILFRGLQSVNREVRWINVDEKASSLIKVLESLELKPFIRQYEMTLVW